MRAAAPLPVREFLERSNLIIGADDMFLMIGQMDTLLSRLSLSPRVLRVGRPSKLIGLLIDKVIGRESN